MTTAAAINKAKPTLRLEACVVSAIKAFAGAGEGGQRCRGNADHQQATPGKERRLLPKTTEDETASGGDIRNFNPAIPEVFYL